MIITLETAKSACGADPEARAAAVLSANAAEILALSAGFVAAADQLTKSLQVGDSAALAASDAGLICDATPLDLLSEVVQTVESLDASPAQLLAIAAGLDDLAAQIPPSQQACHAAIATMKQGVTDAAALAQAASAGSEEMAAHAFGLAMQAVLDADGVVTTIVADHEARVAGALALVHQAGYVLPDTVEAGADGVTVLPTIPSGLPPEQVAAWWAGLTPAEQGALVETNGSQLAALHGLPAVTLDLINRRLLTDDAVALGSQDPLAEFIAYLYAGTPLESPITPIQALSDAHYIVAHPEAYAPALVALAARVVAAPRIQQVQDQVAGGDRYLLEYDDGGPEDEGTAVVALGNPDEADNIAVLVPGTSNGLNTLDDQVVNGEAVLGAMNDVDPDATNAVIVYQGYDAPDDLGAATDDSSAEEGGRELALDLAGYAAANPDDEQLSAVGHSYGSTVIGEALQGDTSVPVDAVVVLGSPGMHAQSAADLGVPGGHVYAGAAVLDPVSLLPWFVANTGAGPMGPHGVAVDSPQFGAIVFDTSGASGHSEYYHDSESLANIGRIAVADYDAVTTG